MNNEETFLQIQYHKVLQSSVTLTEFADFTMRHYLFIVYYCYLLFQQFVFRVLPGDMLEVEVRDKFTVTRPSVSHFMGRLRCAITPFLQQPGGR